ncbi:MAG: pyridoxamine 5'-phosphate oxidase family protein [Ghiorsea sp.]
MTDDWQQAVKTTITKTHIGFLSTNSEKFPETSMVPYAIFEGDILLHLSALARHSKNIQSSPNVGLMICTPETADSTPLALPRLSFQGSIQAITSETLVQAQAVYLKKIPDAEPLFSFPDFTLYRLHVSSVFWVGGFGAARKVNADTWRSLCC